MDVRAWFAAAAQGFCELLPGLHEYLDAPGLGEWDVRSLLGHTCRAFTTIEQYTRDAQGGAEVSLHSPADYFHAAFASLAEESQVTERGKDAGRALGSSPAAAAAEIVERVRALVGTLPDHACLQTPVGSIRLIDYLATRAFEITVHSIDLAAATNQPTPSILDTCTADAIAVCSQIATPAQRHDILFAATGRGALPQGFTVFAAPASSAPASSAPAARQP